MERGKTGTITAPPDLNILPHEMDTARALAGIGMDVEFVRRTWGNRVTSADFVADGVLWEVKAPCSSSLRVVQKHLRAALHQSRDVVFDAQRMKGLADASVEQEVRKWAAELPRLRRLIYISRHGEVVKIKQ